MNNKKAETIQKRQNKNKRKLIETLKRVPIVQVACQQTGIGRASYYRWRQEDQGFAQMADKSMLDGILVINDMAETQLIGAIRDKNFPATSFWLKHHHQDYKTKVEVTARLKGEEEKLNPEQKAIIKKALRLASLSGRTKILNKKKYEKKSCE